MKVHAFQKKWLREKTAEAAKLSGKGVMTGREKLRAIRRKLKYLKYEKALYEKAFEVDKERMEGTEWHVADPIYKDRHRKKIRNTKQLLGLIGKRIKYYENKTKKEKAQII